MSGKKLKRNEQFIVLVNHSVRKKEIDQVIEVGHIALVTDDPIQAVLTARNIEKFGYEFHSGETGAIVHKFEVGKVYPRREFVRHLTASPDSKTVIFVRTYKGEDNWDEQWFDEKTEKQFQKFTKRAS